MITPPAALEALLFASGEPVSKKDLAKLMGISEKELQAVVHALDAELRGRGLVLIEAGEEIELRTAPEAAAIVKKMREDEMSRDLGKASLETLAVIAYQEGATRGEVDWVRGVNSTASLRTLLMRGLIEGQEDPKDRRRIRYRLTTEALAHLGITSASELPRAEELAPKTAAVLAAETAEEST